MEIGFSGVFGVGVGVKRACGKGAVDSQYGTDVIVCILAQRATFPREGLFIFCFNRHTCANNPLNMLKICFLCYSYFSPLQVKNKPCDGDAKYEFILEPVSLVVNRYCITRNQTWLYRLPQSQLIMYSLFIGRTATV